MHSYTLLHIRTHNTWSCIATHCCTYAHLNVHLRKLRANSVIIVCNYSSSRICNNTMNMEKVIGGGEEDTEGRRMVSIFNSIQFWWYLAPETTILILQSHVWMYDCSVQYVIGTQTEKPLYHSLMWHKWCGGGAGGITCMSHTCEWYQLIHPLLLKKL